MVAGDGDGKGIKRFDFFFPNVKRYSVGHRGAAKWVAAIRFVIAYKTVVGFESKENVNRIDEELESMIR